MCNWGTSIELNVLVSARCSYTGQARWKIAKIDSCIAPIVKALNIAGLYTENSCCGHGNGDGRILMQDGSEILIKKNLKSKHPKKSQNFFE